MENSLSTELAPVISRSAVLPQSGVNQLSYNDTRSMAADIAKSGLFANINTTEKAMVLMLLCQAKGLHPITAVERYDIVKERPAMKSSAMLAEFQRQGGSFQWLVSTDECVTGTFAFPSAGEMTVTWDIARATKAQLWGKSGPWQTFPQQMLRARCQSEAVRALAPGVLSGIYSEEEARDMPPLPSPTVTDARPRIDPTPKTGQVQAIPPRTQAPQGPPAAPALTPTKRDQFDALARKCGLEFTSGRDRGEWLNACLSRSRDSTAPFTPQDMDDAIAALPEVIAAEKRMREAASEGAPEVIASGPAPKDSEVEEPLTDPFANDPFNESLIPDATAELKKKDSRDTGTPKGLL